MVGNRDELRAERQALPMVEVEKDYVFEGPDAKTSLLTQRVAGHEISRMIQRDFWASTYQAIDG